MLTIKKRFPYNKLYIAGSLAFVGGYGAIMLLAGYVPQRYEAIQFATNPAAVKEAEPQGESNPVTDTSTTSNEATSTTTRTTPVTSPTPTPTTPATPQTPETPPVTEPLPEVPVIPPVIPTDPEEELPEVPIIPTELVDQVVDLVTP